MDTLDKILLSPRAVDAWNNKCLEFIKNNNIPNPYMIPDEQAKVLGNGDLLIFVDVGEYGKCELVVKRGDWCWNN